MIKALPAVALLTTTAVAVYLASRAGGEKEQGAAPVGSAIKQPSILEVLGMEDITAPLSEQPQADAPRGIRNNNPLNIEKGSPWNGLAPVQTDSRFAQFIDARYGFRAGAIILSGAYRSRGVETLAGILGSWAPKSENDLRAYINHVSQRSGIAPMQVVTREMYPRLFEAMTLHENGQQPYSLEFIKEGVAWA